MLFKLCSSFCYRLKCFNALMWWQETLSLVGLFKIWFLSVMSSTRCSWIWDVQEKCCDCSDCCTQMFVDCFFPAVWRKDQISAKYFNTLLTSRCHMCMRRVHSSALLQEVTDCIEVYEKMVLLLSWCIPSVNWFQMILWS